MTRTVPAMKVMAMVNWSRPMVVKLCRVNYRWSVDRTKAIDTDAPVETVAAESTETRVSDSIAKARVESATADRKTESASAESTKAAAESTAVATTLSTG